VFAYGAAIMVHVDGHDDIYLTLLCGCRYMAEDMDVREGMSERVLWV